MTESARLWAEAGRLAAAGTPAALATVARQRGSLPMASDAKMLVTADGRRSGTVGGGCVEADVVGQALEALEQGAPVFVRHSLNADTAGDIGLSCGGTVELFLEPLFPSSELAGLCRAVADGIAKRSTITVLTGLNWSDGIEKAALVEQRRLSVGSGERLLALDVGPEQRGQKILVDENRSVFVEWISRVPRLIIFGAGHVGAAIARVAAEAGFHVVISDDREDFANKDNIPEAHEIMVGDFNTVLDALQIDEDDYVLAATRGHSYDANIVERTAGSRARYVGMLGSKRKRAVIWKALMKAGVAAEDLDRVHSPIGLEIGADTPAEIAVSVVAELVRTRRLPESRQ
jgi:xanthine dehydrogenase accessory factor